MAVFLLYEKHRTRTNISKGASDTFAVIQWRASPASRRFQASNRGRNNKSELILTRTFGVPSYCRCALTCPAYGIFISMIDQKTTLHSRPTGILLDVRGTLLDKEKDYPLSKGLIEEIKAILSAGKKVGLVSACSPETMDDLILQGLVKSGISEQGLGNLVCYINNSCEAYTYDKNAKFTKLENYQFVDYSLSDRNAIRKAIAKANKHFDLQGVTVKEKVGQFNYYCGGSYQERLQIAEVVKSVLAANKKEYIFVLVPLSKDTIDISISNKSKGVKDFITRFQFAEQELVFISDSLDKSGADYCVCVDFPGIVCIPTRDPNETLTILKNL